MLTVEEKIEHLRKIGLDGDMTEIKKMYSGEEFNPNTEMYKKLVEMSKKYCLRFTELSGLIAKTKDQEKMEKLGKEKSEILDKLFPGHGLIVGGGDGLFAIIGMVDVDGFNYINSRVHFNASALVHLEEYVFVASNVEFGNNDIITAGTSKAGRITVERDTWIGAGVHIGNNTHTGARSLVAMGSNVAENTILKPDMISFGNPCKEYKIITDDYETKTPKPEVKRTDDEIKRLIGHMKRLGIDGDLSQYIRLLTYEKYNTMEPTISKIFDLAHRLCSEYNCNDISVRRRKEILDMLFPIQGNNLVMGDDIYVDCIGTVKIGNDVTIGNSPTLAGNITIGDNAKIGNNVILQTIGHEINYKGRRLGQDEQGNLCEISTPGFIVVAPEIVLADGTKVIPNKTVTRDTGKDELITR